MGKRGIQQRGLDLIFGGKEEAQKTVEIEEQVKEEKKKIILFLRDGLSPADRNFTKYPNEIHDVMRDKLSEEAEGILYIYLWRQSWGFGRNYCRTSYTAINKDTVIGSKRTARRAMAGLVEKKLVVRALDADRERNITQDGGLYRVLTPHEMIESATEEGVLLDDIPEDGVVMLATANMTTVGKNSNNGDQSTMSKMTTANMGSGQIGHRQNGHSGMAKMTMSKTTTPPVRQEKSRVRATGGQNDHSQYGPPLKDNKDNLKDSLSPRAIISGFYKGIGQKKITVEKRERAENSFKELIDDGFDPGDIQFAVEWTLKNTKEELYDFSIIKHTIGQAMAAREKAEAEEAKRIERDKAAAQKEAEEKKVAEEETKIKAYKESLDADERAKLRERAEAEIRNSGQYKEEFITDYLVEAMENDLIRNQIGIESPK